LESDQLIIGVYENLNLNYHEDNPISTNFATYLLDNIHNKKTKFPLFFMVNILFTLIKIIMLKEEKLYFYNQNG